MKNRFLAIFILLILVTTLIASVTFSPQVVQAQTAKLTVTGFPPISEKTATPNVTATESNIEATAETPDEAATPDLTIIAGGDVTAAPTEGPTKEINVTEAVDDEYRWKLEDIYPTVNAWNEDYKQIEETYLPKYAEFEGQLGEKEKFLDFMYMDEQASRILDKLYVYAYMKLDEDNTNSTATEMAGKVESLYTDYSAASSFFQPELLALPDETLQAYIKDEDLNKYQMVLQYILDMKAHTLTAEEEEILANAGELASSPESIYTKITEADLVFPRVIDPSGETIELTEDNFGDLLTNPNRYFREQVYTGLLSTYGTMKNSLAATLDAQIRKDVFFATTRKYKTSLEAALSENSIPQEVYISLVDSTDKNIDALHEYITLRKEVMSVPTVRIYDLYVPLVSGYTPDEFTYEEAQEILAEALAPLGEDYVDEMTTGFQSGWIDVYPAENKTSGAYSWGTYDTHPYILTNYTDSFDSLLTLGHEMGHAMNSKYSSAAQEYYYSDPSIFTAEVASTTNELLILRYMISNASSDEEKLYYLDRLAEDIRGTFFAQVMYAEFELQIHELVEEGDVLTVDTLNQLWGDILKKFYGDDFELTEEASLGWSRIPHFYYNFYVYQYATGIAAANQFSTMLTSEDEKSVDNYIEFLEAGSSDYPVDILQDAGIDMLSEEPVETLFEEFTNVVEEMKALLIKMGKLDNSLSDL